MTSPFLTRPETEHIARNALAFAIRDGFPVSPGHTLVVTRRLVPTWFDATPEEQSGAGQAEPDLRQGNTRHKKLTIDA